MQFNKESSAFHTHFRVKILFYSYKSLMKEMLKVKNWLMYRQISCSAFLFSMRDGPNFGGKRWELSMENLGKSITEKNR